MRFLKPIKSAKAAIREFREASAIRRTSPQVSVHRWLQPNPYCSMLYSRFDGAAKPTPLVRLHELESFASLRDRTLLVHGEHGYGWGVDDPVELQKAFNRYIVALKQLRANGGRMAWTMHDDGTLHVGDGNLERIEAIRSFLGQNSDLVHVHSRAAAALAKRAFGVAEEKIAVVPHPSYATMYPVGVADNWRPPSGKRRLLSLGYVRKYKDFPALAEALSNLPAHTFESLTIAGKPQPDGGGLEPKAFTPSITLDLNLGFVADEDIPAYFHRADFSVLPYKKGMTSGVAAMSLTFGVPIVGSDLGGMREAVPEENLPLIYDREDPDGLARALALASEMSEDDYSELRTACLRRAAEIHPDQVSEMMKQALRSRDLLPG